jgi:hypothetical protein
MSPYMEHKMTLVLKGEHKIESMLLIRMKNHPCGV